MVGHLGASLAMTCQRCLEPVTVAIDAAVRLVFVAAEADGEHLGADVDAVALEEGEQIHLVDLFEDELLLQLPLVAKHPDRRDCGPAAGFAEAAMAPDEPAAEQQDEAGAANPFSVLERLKR